jgi:hypothetical protein
LRTTDGGATWVTQTSGTTAGLLGVSFTDANTGTVVGGTILRTTDGGATWVAQTSGATRGLSGVSFTDANTGTAVGAEGAIVRTTDGGATWVAQTSGTIGTLWGVSFADANTGTAVGAGPEAGTILRTTDGGETWVAQISGTTAWLIGVSFTDANAGTAVGFGGTILRTTDVSGYSDSCDPFCERVDECLLNDRFPNCAPSCGCTVKEGAQVSAECETAVADINACVVDLSSCEQVEAWLDRTPFDSYPCKTADDERDSVCY